MDKMKLIVDAAQRLLKVEEDLRSLSDSVQAVCKLVTEGLSEKPKALPEKRQNPLFRLKKCVAFWQAKVRLAIRQKSEQSYPSMVQAVLVILIQKTMLQY